MLGFSAKHCLSLFHKDTPVSYRHSNQKTFWSSIMQPFSRSSLPQEKKNADQHWHIFYTDSIMKDLEIIYKLPEG